MREKGKAERWCAKCGAEPQQGTTPWGKACWAAYRATRKAKAQMPSSLRAKEVAGTAQTPAPRKRACANCEGLAAEVQALKRQLAEANARSLRMPRRAEQVGAPKRVILDAVGVPTGNRIGKATIHSQTAEMPPRGPYTPHGGQSQDIAARAGQAE